MTKIRKFNVKDFPEILKIEKECFGKDAYREEIFYYLSEKGDFLIARDKQVLGYVLYSWKGDIFSIAVKSEFRRKGIGSILLTKALESLKGKTDIAWLQVRESNTKAQKFFEKFGFKPVRKLRRYYKDEDGILMAKEL